MKIKKNIWEKIVFLDTPLFLLGVNYVLYNALALNGLKMIFRVGALSLLLIGWILKGKFVIDIKSFAAVILAMIAVVLNGSVSLNFLMIVLFCICSTYSINTIIESAFKINMILVIFMLLLMMLHIVNNTSYISTMGRLRYTMGFENPNVAALFYSSAIYLLLTSRKKLNGKIICFAFFMTIIVFYYTNSRTSLLALLIFVMIEGIDLLLKKRSMKNTQIVFGKGAILVVDALFILNVISVFIIDKFMIFDELLSARISSFSKMINSSGWRCFLFGGTFETVDNFYYMLLFQYGIVIYCFVAILTHFAIKRMVTNGNIKHIALLVGLFLVAMMESSLIRPEILVTLVVWKIIFSGDELYEQGR